MAPSFARTTLVAASAANTVRGEEKMAEGRLLIGTRRYSSWSLRGWLAVRLAELDVVEEVIPLAAGGSNPAVKAATLSGTVPCLWHRTVWVWESLAIGEYCAELRPELWPSGIAERAWARAIAAEMHAGFRGLRTDMPMNLFREAAGAGRTVAALADIVRIESLWGEALAASGGPFLFGHGFTIADAMYAPVVCRFLTYRPELRAASAAYCEAVRAHPLLALWYELAAAEPESWRLAAYEAPG